MSKRERGSPSLLGCTWVRRRWTEATESSSAGSAYPEEVEDEIVGSGASRSDCFVVEEEEDPAEVFARVDLHGAAPNVGGELVKHGGVCGSSDERASEDREQVRGERGEE